MVLDSGGGTSLGEGLERGVGTVTALRRDTGTATSPATSPAGVVALAEGFGAPPVKRRRRNTTGAVLGTLLVVACATAVAIYGSTVGHRHPVLVLARTVDAGAVISAADLGEARLSTDPAVHDVPTSRRDAVVGRVAAVPLLAGTLLSPDALARGSVTESGTSVVGLALRPGQAPADLHRTDQVMLVMTDPPGADATSPGGFGAGGYPGKVLVPKAEVFSVAPSSDGQSTVVSVAVPAAYAPAVAATGARDELTLVLLGPSAA